MKKILTLAVLFIIAGMCTINAQRGMRMDSVMMNRMRSNRMYRGEDSLRMRFYHRGNDNMFMMPRGGARWQIPGYGRNRYMITSPMYGTRWERQFMWTDHYGRKRNRIDIPYRERIPDLTEKQRSDISELRQKQRDEINKVREGHFAEIQKMRESHREEFLKILTDEQKARIGKNNPVNK
jgi:hypothetical protein